MAKTIGRLSVWFRQGSKLQYQAADDRSRYYQGLFIVLKGLLMAADWMASSGLRFKPDILDATRSVVHVPVHSLAHFMKEKIERDRKQRPELKPFLGFKPFQNQCGQAEGHVLAIAPTGSGKTEAALLWALNQIEEGKACKLVLLIADHDNCQQPVQPHQ